MSSHTVDSMIEVACLQNPEMDNTVRRGKLRDSIVESVSVIVCTPAISQKFGICSLDFDVIIFMRLA